MSVLIICAIYNLIMTTQGTVSGDVFSLQCHFVFVSYGNSQLRLELYEFTVAKILGTYRVASGLGITTNISCDV